MELKLNHVCEECFQEHDRCRVCSEPPMSLFAEPRSIEMKRRPICTAQQCERESCVRCAICVFANYCSEECMDRDHPEHSQHCNRPRNRRELEDRLELWACSHCGRPTDGACGYCLKSTVCHECSRGVGGLCHGCFQEAKKDERSEEGDSDGWEERLHAAIGDPNEWELENYITTE